MKGASQVDIEASLPVAADASTAVAMSAPERACCAATGRWLAAGGRSAGGLALLAALWAVALLLSRQPWPGLALAALLLVPLERLLALRTAFDAGLFADLAAGRSTLAALDHSLAELRLRVAGSVPRPLSERVLGARRLVLRHAAVAVLQFACVLAQTAFLVRGGGT